ncbi:hypothetical protein M758_10G103200 [Ceratodon purpureus]|uniref:Uncharacterized protein n=1 Tax=Ceratodon purpureus TaxID=3225 RepID=A0A8T0GNZ9_CERPU|nr:hypothetical protein KC19_10G106500 [Ceratodon purpureus]KAG0603566.1 hypothetical protein M758_10G103200 [Ceratodon purpureus]
MSSLQMGKNMGISTQIVVLVMLLTSTAIITRMVVLSNIDPDSFTSPEFQIADCTSSHDSLTATYASQPAKYTNSRYHDEEADPAKYRPYRDALDTAFELHGYIISMKKERYDYASSVLAKLQITPHHYVPYSYNSQLVWDEMQKFNNGSLQYHKDSHNLKMFSHRMAHTGMLFDFVNDQTAKMNSWRFFFEDDIEIHPDVTIEDARIALAKGMEIGAADGIIYLGICGPGKQDLEPAVKLVRGVTARRSHGTCTHAYGVTKWRAAGLLSYLDKVKVPEHYPSLAYMYFDILTRAYGMTVTRAYILGFNLKSPVPQTFRAKQSHVGLIFQDRAKYPSFITPKKNATSADPKKYATTADPPHVDSADPPH